MNDLPGGIFAFGPFRLDSSQRMLWRNGDHLPLTPKEFETLLVLVEAGGQSIGKEALIGRVWPDTFVSDSSLTRNISVLRKVLGEDVIQTLPKFGYRLAMPVSRVANAPTPTEQLATEEAIPTSPAALPGASPTQLPRQKVRFPGFLLAPAVLLITIGAGWLYVHFARRAAASVKLRRSVAVLGFKNLSGRPEADWLSTALTEMVNTELALGEKLRTVPEETVARAKLELPVADAGSFSPQTLTRIHQDLGADFVVTGSYLDLGESGDGSPRRVRVDLRLQDTATGETIISVSDTGGEPRLSELVERAGARLRERLGAEKLTADEATTLQASLPSDPDSARLYSEGLAKLRLLDALAARDLLEKAVAAEPGHPLPHAALAGAWSALGYDQQAIAEARKAFDLSPSLTREDRLLIEGQYREAVSDWQKAVEVYRTLQTLFPDNLYYGLRLASAQVAAGKGRDALATLSALRKLPSAAKDPGVDIEEAHAAEALGDFHGELQSAARAAAEGSDLHASLLVARAWLMQGYAYYNLGDPSHAVQTLDQARAVYAACGDKKGEAETMSLMGRTKLLLGDPDGAAATWQGALSTYRQIGNRSGEAAELSHLGAVRFWQGNVAEAKPFFEQSLAAYREVSNRQGVADELHNMGDVVEVLGDLPGARRNYDEALATDRELGNQRAVARDLEGVSDLLYDQGDLGEAEKRKEEALAITQAIGAKEEQADTLSGLARLLRARGELSEAQPKLTVAIAMQRELGEKSHVCGNSFQLAELEIEQAQPAAAETLIRQVAQECSRDADPAILELLARALLAESKQAEARATILRASALINKAERQDTRFSIEITEARVLAASGNRRDAAEAARRLQAIIAQAHRLGFIPYEFEARLALGEVEIKGGSTAAGRAQLAALETEARRQGFDLVARQADALASKA